VEIEITKLSGDPLEKAIVHPDKAARSCLVTEGKVIVTIKHTGLFSVDINGQMDDQHIGSIMMDHQYILLQYLLTLSSLTNHPWKMKE
jgi:hypothetical protein